MFSPNGVFSHSDPKIGSVKWFFQAWEGGFAPYASEACLRSSSRGAPRSATAADRPSQNAKEILVMGSVSGFPAPTRRPAGSMPRYLRYA